MTWSDGWREAALRAADIPVTDYAIRILHNWEQSTPTDGWTNNPLGIPAAGFNAPRALKSLYAAFPTMDHFRTAFSKAVHTGPGKPLYVALGVSEKPSEAWRAIHSLKWPAHHTETDYPSAVLDMVDEPVRLRLQSVEPSQRKTVGGTANTNTHSSMVKAQSNALHHAATQIPNASLAIAFVIRQAQRNG